MKFSLHIDKNREEEVLVYAHERSRLTDSIQQICESDGFELVGTKDREGIKLDLNEINCFVVDDSKVYALTNGDKLQIKYRLYQLEEKLPEGFVKINQSCIANIKMILRFDASISGALKVRFKNGYVDFVSRRCLKNVKERLGV